MAESRLCLICGAVVDAYKITAHREFHSELDRMANLTEDLRQQVKRLEARLKRSEEAERRTAAE